MTRNERDEDSPLKRAARRTKPRNSKHCSKQSKQSLRASTKSRTAGRPHRVTAHSLTRSHIDATRQFRAQLYPTLRAPRLVVRAEDATLENAAFVARLPSLRRLVVEGEVGYPDGWEVAKLKGLQKVRVSTLSFEASLFVGFLLWDGEQTLRLSDDKLVALAPLRTRERINLCGRGTQPSDLAVLLGALSQNTACVDANDTGDVEEVDANGAPATAPAGVVHPSGRLPGGSRTIRGGYPTELDLTGHPSLDPTKAVSHQLELAMARALPSLFRTIVVSNIGDWAPKDRLRDTLAYLSGFDERTGDVIVHRAARPAAP